MLRCMCQNANREQRWQNQLFWELFLSLKFCLNNKLETMGLGYSSVEGPLPGMRKALGLIPSTTPGNGGMGREEGGSEVDDSEKRSLPQTSFTDMQ